MSSGSVDDDRAAIIELQARHGLACDRRDWTLFDEIYTPEATGQWGAWRADGREAIVAMVRANLGGCGPTQHLHGNHRITIDGDRAGASCAIRAFHLGAGARAHLTWECMGEYHDELVRTPDGWRIADRRMDVAIEQGTRDVLGPAVTDG